MTRCARRPTPLWWLNPTCGGSGVKYVIPPATLTMKLEPPRLPRGLTHLPQAQRPRWSNWRKALGTDQQIAARLDPHRIGVALSPEQLHDVRQIIAQVIPGAQVWVFGSRAKGKARRFSDLDLLLTHPPKLNWAQRAALRDGFEAVATHFVWMWLKALAWLLAWLSAFGMSGSICWRCKTTSFSTGFKPMRSSGLSDKNGC